MGLASHVGRREGWSLFSPTPSRAHHRNPKDAVLSERRISQAAKTLSNLI